VLIGNQGLSAETGEGELSSDVRVESFSIYFN
jgi:hypothetical protein